MLDLNQYPNQGRSSPSREDPVEAFMDAMASLGISCRDHIRPDGQIHRFSTGAKAKDKSGWYSLRLFGDFAAGSFGDWKNGDGSHKWVSGDAKLTSGQQAEYRTYQDELERSIRDGYEKAAHECRQIWEDAPFVPDDFPYLVSKGVPSHGLKIHMGYMVVPIMNAMGQVRSLQRIYHDGSKYNWVGGEKQGNYFTIPGDQSRVYVCEGYATGATIHKATGGMVVVAFDAGNLYPVTAAIKGKYPTAIITICADNDQWKPGKGNAGIEKAKKAGEAFGVRVIWPTFQDGSASEKPTDFNDLERLEGIDSVKVQISGTANQDPWEGQIFTLKDAYAQRDPLKFLVSGLFSLPSLSIVYGAPGTLKSMLLADMAVCVASGKNWLGREVVQGPVLWIDFDNGKRRTHDRFAALARARSLPDNIPLQYVSMPMPWLHANNQEDVDHLIHRINNNGIKLVCIDNLGLISMGAEETKDMMIQVMANIRMVSDATGAAIAIIHHQRKSTTFSARAGDSLRGHSGIEGALDLALLVTRDECGNYITIQSTKTRDVEVSPFMAEFRYDHKYGTTDLQTAQFFKIDLEDNTSDAAVEKFIMAVCKDDPTVNQKKIIGLARKELNAGVNRIRHIYKQLKSSNRINTTDIGE